MTAYISLVPDDDFLVLGARDHALIVKADMENRLIEGR